MEGWSILTNGSALDVEAVSPYHQSNYWASDNSVKDCVGVGADDSDDGCNGKLRCLFNRVLEVFLKEVTSRGVIRHVPAMLGDGLSPDLFKLFWLVRERGGYDLVSKKGLWPFVAKESGLDLGVSPSVKLIYLKYLNGLEEWFRETCRDRKLGNGQCGHDGNFGLLSLELETEFRGLLTNGLDNKQKVDGIFNLESGRSGKYIDTGNGESGLDLSDTKVACRRLGDVGKSRSDDDEKMYDDNDENICNGIHNDCVISDSCVGKKEFNFRKRKRESLAGMLKWVIQVAKHPFDPSIGVIPEPSKWKEHKGKDFWIQVSRAREALFLKRHVNRNIEGSLLEKKLRMHPSMYEDHQSSERLRCSERLPALVKSRACSCCSSCSATESKLSPHKIELDNGPKEQPPVTVDLSDTNTLVSPPVDDSLQKHVSVGPLFQAEVPEWTGVVSESDSKWLGTCVWPLEHGEYNSSIEADPIGRGRPDLCGCRLPGSVECVRLHIAEKKLKLKLELGSVFYRWRFDRMGEEVSLQWTATEEQRFKDMVRSNLPSLNKCFWDNAYKCFPNKTCENLVSYYFNVFLVQRRRYQNRVTPKNIDSDDDESEFGSLSDGFGYAAVQVSGSNFLACSQNKQCTDFE